MASLKSLLASAVTLDEDEPATDAFAALRSHAEKLGAGPDGFAWYEPAKHDRYTARAIVRQLAIGLSSQKLATFLVGKEGLVVAFAPWGDKAKILAESKVSTTKVTAIGPTKPAPVRRAKAPPANVKRQHVKYDVLYCTVGFDTGPAVLSHDGKMTGELDLATWPPTLRPHLEMLGLRAARASDGRFAASGVTVPSSAGPRVSTLRVRDGKSERILDDAAPASVSIDVQSIDGLGFVGDDLVLLPSEPTYRGGKVKRPLVLRPKAKTFVELDELPAVKVAKFSAKSFPPFAVHGFARTGSGDDVLIWGMHGYRGGRTYKRAFDLGTLEPSGMTTVPGRGDSFFVCNVEKIVEVRANARPARRLANAGRVMSIAAGPDGVVLAAIVRAQPKLPIMLAWWPEAREYAPIAGAMFGFKPKVWFSQGHIGYAPASKLVWGFDPISDELRAIDWAAIAALPRTKE